MGDEPQKIINKRILKDADLLVGIFWTDSARPRAATPVARSKRSGAPRGGQTAAVLLIGPGLSTPSITAIRARD
jgi:hypothetical protein